MKKIEELVGKHQPALFTWLTDQERDEAVEDLKRSPLIEAKNIDSPQTNFVYNEPNYDYFTNRKDEMAKKAKPNYIQYLKSKNVDNFSTQKRSRAMTS